MDYLAWGLVAAAALLYGMACRDVAAAAAGGQYDVMGTQMGFSARWLAASLAGGAGGALLVAWWAGIAAALLLYALRWPAYRAIERRFLGTAAPPPKQGFKEFVRRAEGKRDDGP